MKTYPYMKVIVAACVGALASCATVPQITRMPMSATLHPHPDSSLSGRVLQEVNIYRRNHGASDLQRHSGLDRLAQEHCEYLRQHRGSFGIYGGNVSHFGFEGRADMARERYSMLSCSENVAAAEYHGKNPGPLLVSLWAASKGHEFNMRSAWTHTGIGVVVDSDGMVFSTQIFATVTNSQLTNRQKFGAF